MIETTPDDPQEVSRLLFEEFRRQSFWMYLPYRIIGLAIFCVGPIVLGGLLLWQMRQ